MATLQCDICGGKIVVQAGGGVGECANCGASYSLERMREIVSGIKVSQTGSAEDVEQWRALLDRYYSAGDFSEAEKIVKKILEALPSDRDAGQKYEELQTLKYMDVRNGVLLKYSGQAEEVIIPSCVRSIADRAFEGCENLQSVTMSGSVTAIGDCVFLHCQSLKSATIPNCMTRIPIGTFGGCASLQSVTIPDGVTSIENSAFSGCHSLQSVAIPASVTWIGAEAFMGCSSLRSVTIPKGVEKIAKETFYGCSSLQSVTIPGGVTWIDEDAFCACSSLRSVTIPDSVTRIGPDAFAHCDNLSQVVIPRNAYHSEGVLENIFKYTEWLRNRWKQQGRCRNCGGAFKGVFAPVCQRCHQKKDY